MKQRKAPSSRGQRICRCFSENVMVLKAGAGQQVGELLFPLFRWVPPTARRCCISVCNHRGHWAGKSNRSEKQGGESGGTPAQATTVKYFGVYRVFWFEESFPHLSQPSRWSCIGEWVAAGDSDHAGLQQKLPGGEISSGFGSTFTNPKHMENK